MTTVVSRCRISLQVNGINPAGAGVARSATAVTDGKAWASMASTVQRCQDV
jgi:hypothetical protein